MRRKRSIVSLVAILAIVGSIAAHADKGAAESRAGQTREQERQAYRDELRAIEHRYRREREALERECRQRRHELERRYRAEREDCERDYRKRRESAK